jgi:hypothetical protein
VLRVLVTALTDPNLLRVQARALQEFLPPHRLIVVNDAYEEEHFSNVWTPGMPDRIKKAARDSWAVHYRLPQQYHYQRTKIFADPQDRPESPNANTRCADAIQYGVNKLLKQSLAPILILDADMVPYKPFDVAERLREKPLWGVEQCRDHSVSYLWNGLLLIDPKRVNRLDLFNLDCGTVNGEPVDVGGQLHWFLLHNRENLGSFGHFYSAEHWAEMQDGLPPKLAAFMQWSLDNRSKEWSVPETYCETFAHLRAGGNWEVRHEHEASERMERFLEAVSV